MATNVGNLVARLEMKAGQFISEMKRTSRATKQTSAQLKSFARVGRTAFGFLVGGSIVQAAKNITQAAESLDRFANRLGVSARELQAWQLIGERFQVTQQSIAVGLQRLTRRAAEAAQGMGEAQGALRELGISANTFANLSLDEKILLLGRAFENVRNDADRVRLAFKLFDTEGVGFLQFLNEGEAGLIKLRDAIEGQLWSDEERGKLTEMNERLTEANQQLKLMFGNLLAVASVNIGGFFQSISDKLVELSRGAQVFLFQNQAAADKITDTLAKAGATGGRAAPTIFPVLSRAGAPRISPSVSIRRSDETQLGQDQAFAALRVLREKTAESIEIREAQERAMMDRIGRAEAAHLRERTAARERFTDLFALNMVQAAEFGFSSILRSWAQTLQQMLAKAAASKLFSFLTGTGVGRVLGFAEGGVVPGPRGAAQLAVVHGGETITPAGQGMGMVINVDARGSVPGMEVLVRRGVQQAIEASRFNEREGRKRGAR